MSKTLILVKNDLKHQWLSSSTYVAGIVFLVPMILFYWIIVKDYSEFVKNELPIVAFYRVFWMPNLFVIPLLTMRSIAEERRMGTLETMMTTPVRSFQLVLSKFISAYLIYAIFWGITLLFPIITNMIVPQESLGGHLSTWPVTLGCLSFVLLSGACFISIGILSSSLTRSQLVAGMLSFTGVFFVIISGQLFREVPMGLEGFEVFDLVLVIDYLQTFEHFEMFSKGILDIRPFVFYISATIGLLALASNVVEQKL